MAWNYLPRYLGTYRHYSVLRTLLRTFTSPEMVNHLKPLKNATTQVPPNFFFFFFSLSSEEHSSVQPCLEGLKSNSSRYHSGKSREKYRITNRSLHVSKQVLAAAVLFCLLLALTSTVPHRAKIGSLRRHRVRWRLGHTDYQAPPFCAGP